MFVTPAYAQAAGGAAGGFAVAQFLPLIAVFAIMYYFMIRPQQKKMKEHQAALSALRRGDTVVTGGGIVGKITKIGDDAAKEVEVEIAQGVKVRVVKSTISHVLSKTEPAANSN
ncbi:MAG: preprotein translocase subunit YajC [Proteobacteria bacterium]|nr:preprotein translocase subunit YajC [Pseudomonadota bacterium]MBS0571725.1 preprotein translocase subunit YajC [Pseudomonadota bacterium]